MTRAEQDATTDHLRVRWGAALEVVGARDPALTAGDLLLARYAGPARAYHGLAHLAAVLQHVAELAAAEGSLMSDAERATVELAVFFHDAVYETSQADARGLSNEDASAELAAAVLAPLAVPAAITAGVARLVRLTATHDPAPGDTAGAVLCDADLAILAAAPPDYAAYVQAVRTEYAAVPDADFRAGRTRLLAALLDRPAIYRTTSGHQRWEAAARANVAAEVAYLRAPRSSSARDIGGAG
jgi:predicted metal-dependent HD superfamily phosphohydrolase